VAPTGVNGKSNSNDCLHRPTNNRLGLPETTTNPYEPNANDNIANGPPHRRPPNPRRRSATNASASAACRRMCRLVLVRVFFNDTHQRHHFTARRRHPPTNPPTNGALAARQLGPCQRFHGEHASNFPPIPVRGNQKTRCSSRRAGNSGLNIVLVRRTSFLSLRVQLVPTPSSSLCADPSHRQPAPSYSNLRPPPRGSNVRRPRPSLVLKHPSRGTSYGNASSGTPWPRTRIVTWARAALMVSATQPSPSPPIKSPPASTAPGTKSTSLKRRPSVSETASLQRETTP